jgi:hypothetical protein
VRINTTVATIVLSLTSIFCAAACVRSADPSSEKECTIAPGADAHDDEDPTRSIWPIGNAPLPFDESTEIAAGNLTYYTCVAVQNSSETVRAVFCGSLPTYPLRGQCYSHLKDSPVKWQNYCYDAFYEE